ncbi:hypothetical protein O9929_02100 [Vibrio lentus]|nr:hypothetical protein [Vibrio lentus]
MTKFYAVLLLRSDGYAHEVTSNCLPTSSRVWSVFMSIPKNTRSTASRGVEPARTSLVAPRRLVAVAESQGGSSVVSSMKSPIGADLRRHRLVSPLRLAL